MGNQNLWFMRSEPNASWDFSQALLRDNRLGVLNTQAFRLAEYALDNLDGILSSEDKPLPSGFPALQLAMPDDFTPDYFHYDCFAIVSRQMKDALAQQEHVVQFVPVELINGGPQAQAREYHLMRILPRQPAIDLERSECDIEEHTNRVTGQTFKWPTNIWRFVLRDDLQPRTEIFRVDEIPSEVLVVDELAERVLRAGCTGVEFSDPANRQGGKRVERYRTLDGFAERKVGFLN
jgi:hypothetical protein